MTGTIAPHEHCEVRLVLAGTKPLATIEKEKDPMGFSMAVACINAGMLRGIVQPTKDCPTGEVALTLPKNVNLLDSYKHLLEEGVKLYGIKEYHRKMGKIFGYREEDIEEFIKAEIKCDCSKCRGE